MSNDEILYHWNYFRSLCRRLEETRTYVDHGILNVENDGISNKDVFSSEFQQLLILACVEFEDVGKIIAKSINPDFNMNADIKEISKIILAGYPKIVDFEVYTDNRTKWKPLENWNVIQAPDNAGKTIHVGIEWWRAYTAIKHHGYEKFHLATLFNAIEALASLNVLELYLMQIMTGDTWIATTHPCAYFGNDYLSEPICASGSFPGFGN